jgi:DHA1 family multidrug resistance protein-like MFS transporter
VRSGAGAALEARGGLSTAVAGVVVLAVAAAAFARIPLLPDIGVDLGLSAGEIGLLITAFGLGRLATDLPAGRLADVAPPAPAMAGAGALLAVSCGLLAIAGTMTVALVASVLIGCASALNNTTGMYVFATSGAAARRGATMGVFVTALMTGQMLGPALGGAVGSLADWRVAIGVSAAIGVAVAVGCGLISLRGSSAGGHSAAGARSDPEEGAAVAARIARPPRRVLVALALAPFATFFAVAGVMQTLIPLIGDADLGFSASAIGLALAAGAAFRFASSILIGAASDRFSRRRVLLPSLAMLTLGAAVLALPTGVASWAGGIALVALGSSAITVASAALADVVPPEELGRELGWFRLVGDVGLLAGPLVTAFAYELSGARIGGLAATAVFAAATLAAAAWVEDAPRPAKHEDTGEMLLE